MKVTGIDIRTLPYDEAGLTRRTIYVARTDIVVCRYESGATLYARPDPGNPNFMVRPDWSRSSMPMSFAASLEDRVLG